MSNNGDQTKTNNNNVCNIQSGRNTRLETALWALGKMGVDLCFLTETKVTDGIYTQLSSDYHVLATNAMSHHQGGIALVYRDSPYWQVESFYFMDQMSYQQW